MSAEEITPQEMQTAQPENQLISPHDDDADITNDSHDTDPADGMASAHKTEPTAGVASAHETEPAASMPITPEQQRERAAQLAENTQPGSTPYHVYLAHYFGTSPAVIACRADRFESRFMMERYQDALQKERLGLPMTSHQCRMIGNPVQWTLGTGSPTAQQGGAPANTQDSSTVAPSLKAQNFDHAQIIKNMGISMLSKHYNIPVEEVSASPELYYQKLAQEGASVPIDDSLTPETGATQNSSPFLPGKDGHSSPFRMDAQQRVRVEQDPLSADSGLKQLILQNGELFTGSLSGRQQDGSAPSYPNFRDNVPGGKGRTSVFVFDNGTRPEDKGVKGTSYGGVAYTVSTDALGNTEVHGPYRVSTYANSKSPTDNRPATAEVKGKSLSEGGMDYINEYGHKLSTNNPVRALNFGEYGDDNGRRKFDLFVDATGPNPLQHNNPTIQYAEFHPGKSDNGGFKSRGSQACYTVHPVDSNSFFTNFEWNKKNTTTGPSYGKVYTYRGNSVESLGLKHWLESQNPTK